MVEPDTNAALDPDRQVRAKTYARIRRRLMLLSILLGAAYLLLWVLLDWGPSVQEALSLRSEGGILSFQPGWVLKLLLFSAALAVPWSLIDLPLSFYSGYILPHRFELSNQTLRGWISDQLKGALVSLVIGTPLLVGLFALLRYTPDSWWVWGASGYSLFAIVLTALAPVLLMPFFFKFKPLDEAYAELEGRLMQLSRKAGARVEGVFTFDMSRRTSTANAALAGLGRSRRIILGDTLLENFNKQEIETILAHELAHHVHRDIPLGIIVQVPLTFAFFYIIHLVLSQSAVALGLSGISDPANLPMLVLLFSGLGLVTMPLTNAWSRWRERMADDFAVDLTANPAAFASAMTRLANQNLADVDPEPWVVFLLHSHPPLRQRIQRAQIRAGIRPG